MTAFAMPYNKPRPHEMRIEHFSVERCKQLIEKQPSSLQRQSNMTYVRTYARLMKQANWIGDLPDNVIVISDTGELIDGLHRCRASVMADTGFDAWVSYGWQTGAIKHLGVSNPRRLSQTLKMTGGEDSILMAASAKMFFNYICGDNPLAPIILTTDDIDEVRREFPGFGEWVNKGRRLCKSRAFASATPVSSLLVYLLGRTAMMNEDVAERFWEQIETGKDTTDTTLLLRNMWLNFRGKRASVEGKIWYHNTCVRAWERFHSGTSGKTIVVPRDRLLEWR